MVTRHPASPWRRQLRFPQVPPNRFHLAILGCRGPSEIGRRLLRSTLRTCESRSSMDRMSDAAFDALTSLYLVKDALAGANEPPDKTTAAAARLAEAHMTPKGRIFRLSRMDHDCSTAGSGG